MVIAQTLLVLPIIAALTRQFVGDALRDGGDQLRSMGASRLACALLMLVHGRWAVMTVLIAAFGRAIAEVGAVMIVGGNIDGFTRVMTTAIALETSKGDLPLAMALGLVLLAVVALVQRAARPGAARPRFGAGGGQMHASCELARRVGAFRCGARAARRAACASGRASSWCCSAPTAPARPRCCACCMVCWRIAAGASRPAMRCARRWCSSGRS